MLDMASTGSADGVFERLVAGLKTEFGHTAGEGLARVFVEAEAADFYWDARRDLRWLGSYECPDPDEDELLDRVAVSGLLDGRFYVAVLVVDSRDRVHAMLGLRRFGSRDAADRAFAEAR